MPLLSTQNLSLSYRLRILLIVIFVLAATGIIWQKRPPAETTPSEDFVPGTVPLITPDDLAGLIQITGADHKRFVLLGESSHGTHEFYYLRDQITRRLIAEKGLDFIMVEGDWDEIARLNDYITHENNQNRDGRQVMDTFVRWPKWLWANEEFLALVEWLRDYNAGQSRQDQVQLYGMHLYEMGPSIARVQDFVQENVPQSAEFVRTQYDCLARYDVIRQYLQQTSSDDKNCETALRAVVSYLEGLSTPVQQSDPLAYNQAMQNAYLIEAAEKYYREIAQQSGVLDSERIDVFQTLYPIAEQTKADQRGIVWAHNTHIGDARATSTTNPNQPSVGQWLREKFGEENTSLVGFGTNTGSVIASTSWEAAPQIMSIPPPKTDSVDAHLAALLPSSPAFILDLNRANLPDALHDQRGQRAIGVVYHRENEQQNYVQTILPERYDAFVFIQETSALTPL